MRQLGFERSSRETDAYPIWLRRNHRGFAIWLADVRLDDASREPPTWRFRLEASGAGASDAELKSTVDAVALYLDQLGVVWETV